MGVLYRVKEVRCRNHMTQQELSDKSGVSRATIASLEVCNESDVNLSTMLKLAKALNTSVDGLFYDAGAHYNEL